MADENPNANIGVTIVTYAQGNVVDELTGNKCPNATIKYVSIDNNTVKTIKTDKHGNFIINKLETGTYNWYVESNEYKNSSFLSYPVISGGNNYKFEISNNLPISRKFERQAQTSGEAGAPLSFKEVQRKLSPQISTD